MKRSNILSKKVISKYAKDIVIRTELSDFDYGILERNNINPAFMSGKLISIEFQSLGCYYRGIGIKNCNRGCEFFCDVYNPSFLTLGRSGLIHIKKRNRKDYMSAMVFTNIRDYLSFCTKEEMKENVKYENADFIILNEPKNFSHAVSLCNNYSQIYCFLPPTLSGIMMFMTIKDVVQSGQVEMISHSKYLINKGKYNIYCIV